MLSTIDTEDGMVVESLKSTSDPLFNRQKHVEPKLSSNPECEDSFLELEEKVTEQCQSPYNCDKNFDNTLEFVDFILKHAQSQEKNVQDNNALEQEIVDNKECCEVDSAHNYEILSPINIKDEQKSNKGNDNTEKSICAPTTPVMKCDQTEILSSTHNPRPKVAITFSTPSSNKKETSNIFKTPKIPLSSKKDASGKKTPSRSKAYQHIASPIATYIRNCPQVPLVKDVHPRKPLPSTSFIPKLMKNAPEIKSDKENIVLPSLAYRNAKKTLVIDVNKEKLPQNSWAQKLTCVPWKPVVIKHNHREAIKKPLSLQQQEDSFEDLTLHQADVSVCTQKLAFQKL